LEKQERGREEGREGGRAYMEEDGAALWPAPKGDVEGPEAVPVREGGVGARLREGGREG